MKRYVPCIGPSYQLADRKSAVQRSVNLYLRQVEAGGEDGAMVLDHAPGLEVAATVSGITRGIYATDSRMFVVAGDNLYEVSKDMATVVRGSLLSSDGRVEMRHGYSQLAIVDGNRLSVMNLESSDLEDIRSDGWRGSYSVDSLDGYSTFIAPGTDQFYISAPDNAKLFDALDFSSADASPGNLLAQVVLKRELYLFKSESCEIWIDSGDSDFPFTRYNSTPIDIGVVGRYAVTRTTDSVVWVGRTAKGWGYVYSMRGHAPQRISTQAVEEALQASDDLTQASCWTYHTRGNEFVGINAPGLETTWVYDVGMQAWHERAEWIDGAWAPLRVWQLCFFNGSHYAIDGTTGNIYRMHTDLEEIDGEPLRVERTWPHLVQPSMDPVVYRGLELRCSTGNGGDISLECSNDGGFNFMPPRKRNYGANGHRVDRIRWQMLGTARDRVFRLSGLAPMTIHAAAVDAG